VDTKLLSLNKIIIIIIAVIDRFVEMNFPLEEFKDSEYILIRKSVLNWNQILVMLFIIVFISLAHVIFLLKELNLMT